MGRWSNVSLGYRRRTRIQLEGKKPARVTVLFVGHPAWRALERLHLTAPEAEHECRIAIARALRRGPLPDSGNASGHKLAVGWRGVWCVSPDGPGVWICHSVVPRSHLRVTRGSGRWWIVKHVGGIVAARERRERLEDRNRHSAPGGQRQYGRPWG